MNSTKDIVLKLFRNYIANIHSGRPNQYTLLITRVFDFSTYKLSKELLGEELITAIELNDETIDNYNRLKDIAYYSKSKNIDLMILHKVKLKFLVITDLMVVDELSNRIKKNDIDLEDINLDVLGLKFLIQKRDPIELISMGEEAISFLCSQVNNYNYFNYLKHSKFKFDIEMDIKFLSKEGILTSRLGKLIYKLSTLDAEASDTKIGNYYRKEYGRKSIVINDKHYSICNCRAYRLPTRITNM